MLIDDITIRVSAGNGGKGAVAFTKNMMSLGPAGGNGGLGGSVYAVGVSDLSALGQFRFKKEFNAEDGRDGRGQFRDGHDGKNLLLKVPVGTVIHNLTNGTDVVIEKTGERVIVAQGGKGGKGNIKFKSARHTTPTYAQSGLPGESFNIRLELKFIADVGFVGLPNVGKSSLLNALTNAESKVANYAFTTLEPNLGAYYNLILADIPGLIEDFGRQGPGYLDFCAISSARGRFSISSRRNRRILRKIIKQSAPNSVHIIKHFSESRSCSSLRKATSSPPPSSRKNLPS